ncbi:hypothetical protein BGX27_007995 [Mortierella sp. AM989]|nr:hypothetical protein BGX27_007995 [Mortierella sp. AM989]
MTVTESIILNIASNGPSTTTRSSSSHQGTQLQEIQMAELQAPQISELSIDFDSRPASSKDLFGDMEPHLKLNNGKASVRSKL